jgi:pimeloyl-ACP methyl ester carboxylesterase
MVNYKLLNEQSKKTPILLLHGWGGSIESLSPLQDELAKELENPIYNLELPGFGSTPLLDGVAGTHDYATYVSNFLKEKKISEVILIGHSFGGKISIDIVTTKLFRVKQLVLINASGVEPKNTTKKTINKFLAGLIPQKLKDWEKLREIYYKKVLGERDYLTAGKLKESLSKIVEEHYQDKLELINIPTLIVWGELDSYVPLWMGRLFEETIRLSKLIVVPDATHGLPLKQPKITSELVSKWLNESGRFFENQ